MKTPPPTSDPFSNSAHKRKIEESKNDAKRQKTIPRPQILPKGAQAKPSSLVSQILSTLSTTKPSSKEDPLVTPPNARIPQAMPATPGWNLKRKKIDTANFFKGDRLAIETDPHPIDMGLDISTNNIYRDSGVARNVFKQPGGSKSCWAYCLAMLASDLLRENQNEIQLGKLQEWMDHSSLLNANKVKSFASTCGIKLEHTKIPLKKSLEHLRNQLERSGHPVLISIEHKQIQGHAIVIDHITDAETILRDPFTGKAWKIPNAEMIHNIIDDGVEQSCLSLSTESN